MSGLGRSGRAKARVGTDSWDGRGSREGLGHDEGRVAAGRDVRGYGMARYVGARQAEARNHGTGWHATVSPGRRFYGEKSWHGEASRVVSSFVGVSCGWARQGKDF